MATALNRDSYDREVLESKEPVLVDFWGPQCKPCLALMPIVERIEGEYAGKLKVVKVNARKIACYVRRFESWVCPPFCFIKTGPK